MLLIRHSCLCTIIAIWTWTVCYEFRSSSSSSRSIDPMRVQIWWFSKWLQVHILCAYVPIFLWGRCGIHNSPPVSSVMDPHLLLFRYLSCLGWHSPPISAPVFLFSSRWHHLQSLSSDVVLVPSLHVSKPPQSCFPTPLCYIMLYLQSLPDVIISHMVS